MRKIMSLCRRKGPAVLLMAIIAMLSAVITMFVYPPPSRAATIGSSIPFEYGSGIILNQGGVADSITFGPGLTETRNGIVTTRMITASSRSSDSYVDYFGAATYVDDSGNVHDVDIRIYFWATGEHDFYIDTWGTINAIAWNAVWDHTYDPEIYPGTEWVPGLLHMEWHFFEGDTLESQTPKELTDMDGYLLFEDCDQNEGFYCDSIEDVYLSENTYIRRQTEGIYDGYYIGTQTNNNLTQYDEEDFQFGFTYHLGSDGLNLVYYQCAGWGSSASSDTVILQYLLIGDIPAGYTAEDLTPASKNLARYTDTRGSQNSAAATFYDYVELPGYTFTGWKTSLSLSGSDYTGTSSMDSDITLYGQYVPNDATVLVRYVDEDGNELVPYETINGKVGQSYSTSQKTIPGYRLSYTPSDASGTMVAETITVTYVYTPVDTSILVRHVDEEGNNLATPETVNGKYGQEYTTSSRTFTGYQLKTTPANASGTMDVEQIVITYVYALKDSDVLVNHVDTDGNVLSPQEEIQGKYGDSYATSEKEIPGYKLTETPSNASGTMGEDTTVVTYVYDRIDSDVIVNHVDTEGNVLSPQEEIKGKYGDSYTTSEKDITGYELTKKPSNASGTMGEQTTVVTYVYDRKDSEVIVKHVDTGGNELASQEYIEGKYGDSYTTSDKEITGYVLTKTPDNATGTMGEETTVVTYVYDRKDTVVYVNHVDEDGNPLVPQEEIIGKYKDPYSTEPEDIPGYRVKEVPDNKDGYMGEDPITVTWIYEKVDRQISGLAWTDPDNDGIRESGENMHPGLEITLYRTTPSVFDDDGTPAITIDGVDLYTAYSDTGSILASQTTGDDGSYLFRYLEEGTYYAVCTDTGDYYLTEDNAGDDDTVDSDMHEAENAAFIPGIIIPAIGDLEDKVYVSASHDIGLVRSTEIRITKLDGAGDLLAGADLALYHSDDVKNGELVNGAEPVDTWTSGEDPHVLKDMLLAGYSYTLLELDVTPAYYLSEPVTFTVKDTSEVQGIAMVDEFRPASLSITKLGEDCEPLEGVEYKLSFLESAGGREGDFLLEEGDSITGTTDSDGKLVFENLDQGTYQLTETATVDGYSLLAEPVTVELPFVIPENDASGYDGLDLSEGVLYDGDWYFFDCGYVITDHAEFDLPQTGGTGFRGAVIPGMAAVAAGTLFLLRRKKFRS